MSILKNKLMIENNTAIENIECKFDHFDFIFNKIYKYYIVLKETKRNEVNYRQMCNNVLKKEVVFICKNKDLWKVQ